MHSNKKLKKKSNKEKRLNLTDHDDPISLIVENTVRTRFSFLRRSFLLISCGTDFIAKDDNDEYYYHDHYYITRAR